MRGRERERERERERILGIFTGFGVKWKLERASNLTNSFFIISLICVCRSSSFTSSNACIYSESGEGGRRGVYIAHKVISYI